MQGFQVGASKRSAGIFWGLYTHLGPDDQSPIPAKESAEQNEV